MIHFMLLFFTVITSISYGIADDTVGQFDVSDSNAQYFLVHEYPNSKDSHYFGTALIDGRICESEGLTKHGYAVIEAARVAYETVRIPGGYAAEVSAQEFWESVRGYSETNCRTK